MLVNIADGKIVRRFIDVSTVLDMKDKKAINSLPKKTRRLIVKGYNQKGNEKYLFCSCIDRGGNVIERKEGTQTRSYDNLLVKCSAVVSNLSKLDYIFHMPLSTIEELEQPTKSAVHMDNIEGQLKSPPEEMMPSVEEETTVDGLVDETMEAVMEEDTKEASVEDEAMIGIMGKTTVASVEEETTACVAEETMTCVVKETMVDSVETESILATVVPTTRTKRKTAQRGRKRISVAIASSGMAHVDDTKVKQARKK